MAKNKMQIKYKSQKRERNKNNIEVSSVDSAKSFGKTLIGVVVFLGVMYLCVFGMQKLGIFEKGYTKPTKEETTFSYEYIKIGTVFNRSDKTYYVLFDNYKNNYTNDAYINTLLSKSSIPVYKVDMNVKENQSAKGNEPNRKATKPSELSINDITLIKINNGKITDYVVSRDSIEEYLK